MEPIFTSERQANNNDSIDETPIAKITSEQILELTPSMTYEDIINILGETQDIGSGIYILVYEVDRAYKRPRRIQIKSCLQFLFDWLGSLSYF